MSEQTRRLFEKAIAGWKNNLATCVGGDGTHSVYPPEFVRVMFLVAAESGSISCHAMDNETLCFVIAETETRTYAFQPFHAIRVLLAAIAHLFWNHDIKPNFNVYGDKAEIVLEIDNRQIRFEVETANSGTKSLFFRIRKVGIEHAT